jgi:2-(1,2-epoxy-1,2-dihydrophenyl)acetyl-CoA isomerase
MSSLVTLHHEGAVGWLTLDRPERANAFGMQMVREFCAALASAEANEECSVLVIAGAGDYFSGGGDVQEMAGSGDIPAYLNDLVGAMHKGILALARSRLVTIAAVHGVAAGAGLGIALCTDLVVASATARFVGAYGKIGLTPDCGVSYLLPRIVGPRRAAEICLAGRIVGATDAVDWGLATEVVEVADLQPVLRARAEAIAAGASHAYGPTKRLLGSDLHDLAAHLDDEARTIVAIAADPRTAERIEGFARRVQA